MSMVAEAWGSYARNAIPRDASEDRRKELCIAFFGGAQALWHLAFHDRDEAARARRLDDLGA